ncbi:MAG: hypothetical protein R3C16_13090 [Hyphomonadaceae bacterium]
MRGVNFVDGGAHYYDAYETADGKYVAVGAVEPQFYRMLLEGLELGDDPDFAKQGDPEAVACPEERSPPASRPRRGPNGAPCSKAATLASRR